ncbi:hypothetical protein pb186bvf_014224 [Paramecium bursaria]
MKLVQFAMTSLSTHVYFPNNKHRDNALYVFMNRDVILKALEKHSINDSIIQSGLTILNRSIGIGKFRGEDRAQLISNSKLPDICIHVFHRPNEALKVIYDILDNLLITQLQTGSLAPLVIGILHTLILNRPSLDEMRRGFNICYRLLVQNIIQTNIDLIPLIKEILQMMSEFSESQLVIRECLRLLLLLVKNEIFLIQIRENQLIPINILTQILITYDIQIIKQKGSLILQKIILYEEIEKAIASVQQQNQDAEQNMTLLACLVPEIHQKYGKQLYEIIHDLITNHKKLNKRKLLVKDALLAASQMIDLEYDLSKLTPFVIELYESEDQDITNAAFDVSRKLGLNDNKTIEKIIHAISQFRGLREGLRLLLSILDDKTFKSISKGREAYLKVIDHSTNEIVQEYNSKLIIQLCQQKEDNQYYSKKASTIFSFMYKNITYKRAIYLYVKLLSQLNDINLKKSDNIFKFISVLYDKQLIFDKEQLQEKQESDNEDDDEEYKQEPFNNQFEINQLGIQIIKQYVKQDDVKQYFKEYQEQSQKYLSKPNNEELQLLESQIVRLGYANQIQFITQDKYHIILEQTQQYMRSQNQQKLELYRACLIQTLQVDLRIILSFLVIEETILYSLISLTQITNYTYDKQQIRELIQILLSLIKKNTSDEIQLKILEVIKKFMLVEEFKNQIDDLPKILLRRLPDEQTTREYGLYSIDILMQAHVYENSLKYIAQFQIQHQNVQEEVSGFIKEAEKHDIDNFFTQELKNQIKEMIQYLLAITDISLGQQYLEQLSAYSMMEKILLFMIENKIVESLDAVLLQHQLPDNFIVPIINILQQAKVNRLEKSLQLMDHQRHTRNTVLQISKYINSMQFKLTDVVLILDLIDEYEGDRELIRVLKQILCRSQSDQFTNQIFISKLIKDTIYLIRQGEIGEEVQENLDWIISLSKVQQKILIQEKAQDLAYLIINDNKLNEQFIIQGYEILINLSNGGFPINIKLILASLEQKQYVLQNLKLLPSQLEDNIQHFIDLNGDKLVSQYAEQYPIEVEIIQRKYKAQLEQEQRKKLQLTVLERKVQDIIQNSESFEEGTLNQLFEGDQNEAWNIASKITSHQQIAKIVLQPNSQLYKATLDNLEQQNQDLAAQILETAGNISQVPESLEQLGQTDAPNQMLQLIEKQSNNPEVVIIGLEALQKVCQEEMIVYKLGDGNGIELQKELMIKHKDNNEVIHQCQEIIQIMSKSEAYQEKIADLGILDQIIQQIKDNREVESGVNTLASLVFKNPDNSQKVLHSNILNILIENTYDENVDKATALLITNMVYKNEEIKNFINVDFLVKLFQKHVNPPKQSILEETLKALFGLASILENAQRMIEMQLMVQLIELSFTNLHDLILQCLGMQYKLITQVDYQCTAKWVESLMKSIEVEKLDMPALRILRHIFSKEIALQIIDYDGVYRLMRVIKRQDPQPSMQALDIIVRIIKLNPDILIEFEKQNLAFEMVNLVKQQKLYDYILEITIHLSKIPQQLLENLVETSQNLNDEQIDKIIQLLESQEINQKAIPLLLQLLPRYNKCLAILQKLSTKYCNEIYVNNGVTVVIENFTDNQITFQIILNIAKHEEEYRQQIKNQYLEKLIKLQAPEELIKFLNKPIIPPSKLTEEIKAFLLKGEILKLYKEDGSRGYLRVHCTEGHQQLRCKRDSEAVYKQKWITNIKEIESLKSDYDKQSILKSPFHNQNWFVKQLHKMKNKNIDPNKCLTINFQKGHKPKSLNILFKSQASKDKWVEYIKIVMETI